METVLESFKPPLRVSLPVVVIKRSSAVEIDALIADLHGADPVRRDSAVARLSIIGDRAVERVLAALAAAPSTGARLAALQVLEAIGDVRALDPVLAVLEAGDQPLATAASSVARSCLRADPGTRTLDRLTALVLDTTRPEAARLRALEVLSDLPARTIEPIIERLREDPSAEVRRRAAQGPLAPIEPDPARTLEAAGSGEIPDDPRSLRELVAGHGAEASLSALHRLVEALRRRELAERDPSARAEWMATRAAVHQVLATRGSNVALYDLRETLERSEGPLAVEFLAALNAIGDQSCLEPIVAAYARSVGREGGAANNWWPQHLADAFRQIVRRERLTERHAAMRRIRTRWPAAAAELLARRQRPARGGKRRG
jgi:HEAT repeat protein